MRGGCIRRLVLSRNVIMLQHFIIQFSFHCLSTGRLREVKKKRKLQIFSSKSGLGWYFGKLVAEERWSLTRGGPNRSINSMSLGVYSIFDFFFGLSFFSFSLSFAAVIALLLGFLPGQKRLRKRDGQCLPYVIAGTFAASFSLNFSEHHIFPLYLGSNE